LATIDYESDFKHTDWIDNVTRVKAGGEDGFNHHFHDIEDEFKKLSDVVTAIKDAMDQLAQKPPAKPIAVGLTPVLVTTGPAGWEHVAGSARKPTGAASAAGTMSVDLPDGVTVQTLRVIGENSSTTGALVIQLRRQKLDPSATSEPVIGVTGAGGPFDSKNTPQDPTRALVDTDQFRYFITARVDGAGANDVVRLDGFQIVHILQP
jgi:hypothetical protein